MAAVGPAEGSAKAHEEEAVGFLASSSSDARSVAAAAPEADVAGGRKRSCRLGRKFILLTPVALVSMVLAFWGMSSQPDAQRWLHGAMQGKWLFRSDGKGDIAESIADCVFDSQFATQNMMALGLSIAGVANSCPAAQQADDKSKERWVDAVKSAHSARITAVFGEKSEEKPKGGFHGVASAALDKVQSVLSQYKKSGAPQVKHHHKQKSKFAAAMEDTQESVKAFSDAKHLANVAEANRRVCAADVSAVLARMSYVASNIAHLTSECRSVFDQKAYCTGDITRLLAGLTMTASSAAEISASCTEYEKYIGADVTEDEFGRRLKGEHLTEPVKQMFDAGVSTLMTAHDDRVAAAKARDFEVTTCVTASWFAATFFARFLDMGPTVKHCSPGSGLGTAHCAASIIDLFSSLSWTASSISYAVSECPIKGESQSAFCAAGITKLVAAVADTAAALAVVTPTCINNSTKDRSR